MKDKLQYDLMLMVNERLTKKADELERKRLTKEKNMKEFVSGLFGIFVFILLVLACGFVEGLQL